MKLSSLIVVIALIFSLGSLVWTIGFLGVKDETIVYQKAFYNKEIQRLETEREKAINENENLTKKIEELELANKALSNMLEKTQAELTKKIEGLELVNKALNKQLKKTQAELEVLK